MNWSLDARVPLIFGAIADAGPEDALLIEGDTAPPSGQPAAYFTAATGHAPGCACCVPRTAAAAALGSLFLSRARGEIPFFRRVVAVVADAPALRAALAGDPLVTGRFRVD